MVKPQEFFDKTIQHLVAQGRRSGHVDKSLGEGLEGHFLCDYRSPDGLKCAAGFHIPDNLYGKDMEGRNIQAILADDRYARLRPFFPDTTLAHALQRLHDDATNWNESGFCGHVVANEIAQRHGLTKPFPEEVNG